MLLFFDVFYFCTMFLWEILIKCTKLHVYNWTVQLWWLCGWLFFYEALELNAMKYVIMRIVELSMVSRGLSYAATRFVLENLRLKLAKHGTKQVLGGSCAWRFLSSACIPGNKIWYRFDTRLLWVITAIRAIFPSPHYRVLFSSKLIYLWSRVTSVTDGDERGVFSE